VEHGKGSHYCPFILEAGNVWACPSYEYKGESLAMRLDDNAGRVC